MAALFMLTWPLLVMTGCESFFISLIAFPPNAGETIEVSHERDEQCRRSMRADHFLRVNVDEPEASIGVWIIDPAPEGHDPVWPGASRDSAFNAAGGASPRGTIFILHGVTDGPFWVRERARAFARHGYRAVLIGLRGYAESTGAVRGFGVLERSDLVSVANALERLGLLVPPLGVWGVSYGGATAIQYAAIDPRVRAVVTVGAFAEMLDAVPTAIRATVPVLPWFYSDAELRGFAWVAAHAGGYHAEQASAEESMRRIRAPVLLIHGDWDAIVPPENAERLHAAAPDRSRVVTIPATGHFGTFVDIGGRVQKASIEWFDACFDPRAEAAIAAWSRAAAREADSDDAETEQPTPEVQPRVKVWSIKLPERFTLRETPAEGEVQP